MEPLKMKEKLKPTEVWFKLVLFVFFGLFFLLAIPSPEKSKQFSQLIAVFSLIMIVISLTIDFTRKGKVAEGIADVDDAELKLLDAPIQKNKKKKVLQGLGNHLDFYGYWLIRRISLHHLLFTNGFSSVLWRKGKFIQNYGRCYSNDDHHFFHLPMGIRDPSVDKFHLIELI
jgi:hypothetical protein